MNTKGARWSRAGFSLVAVLAAVGAGCDEEPCAEEKALREPVGCATGACNYEIQCRFSADVHWRASDGKTHDFRAGEILGARQCVPLVEDGDQDERTTCQARCEHLAASLGVMNREACSNVTYNAVEDETPFKKCGYLKLCDGDTPAQDIIHCANFELKDGYHQLWEHPDFPYDIPLNTSALLYHSDSQGYGYRTFPSCGVLTAVAQEGERPDFACRRACREVVHSIDVEADDNCATFRATMGCDVRSTQAIDGFRANPDTGTSVSRAAAQSCASQPECCDVVGDMACRNLRSEAVLTSAATRKVSMPLEARIFRGTQSAVTKLDSTFDFKTTRCSKGSCPMYVEQLTVFGRDLRLYFNDPRSLRRPLPTTVELLELWLQRPSVGTYHPATRSFTIPKGALRFRLSAELSQLDGRRVATSTSLAVVNEGELKGQVDLTGRVTLSGTLDTPIGRVVLEGQSAGFGVRQLPLSGSTLPASTTPPLRSLPFRAE